MNDYLQSIIDRDPAAKSKLSLILTYPGVKAIFFYKIANFFAIAKFDLDCKNHFTACKIFNWNRNSSKSKDWKKFIYRSWYGSCNW